MLSKFRVGLLCLALVTVPFGTHSAKSTPPGCPAWDPQLCFSFYGDIEHCWDDPDDAPDDTDCTASAPLPGTYGTGLCGSSSIGWGCESYMMRVERGFLPVSSFHAGINDGHPLVSCDKVICWTGDHCVCIEDDGDYICGFDGTMSDSSWLWQLDIDESVNCDEGNPTMGEGSEV